MAERVLGYGVLDLSKSINSASQENLGGTFESQVCVTCDGLPALADIECGAAIEDDGSLAPGPFMLCGIHVRRTLLSVTLGFVVALTWLEQGGGQLSGAGLHGLFASTDLEGLVIRFRTREINGRLGIIRLARSIVGDAVMDFS
jgi:hypothetical protein